MKIVNREFPNHIIYTTSLAIKNFSNTNIVSESKSHPIPRNQFGLPLTILIDCNGNIDNYMLFGAYISN